MITAAVRQRWAVADFDRAMHLLVHGGVIGRMRHIHNEGHVRFERVSNLPRTQQPAFLHDV